MLVSVRFLVRAFLLAILVTGLVSTSACGNTPTVPTTPATFTLQVGQTAVWGSVNVTFVGVVNDSRCPLNAFCIASVVPGDAVAAFTVTADRRDNAFELALNDPANRSATIGNVVVAFNGLGPYPVAGQPTRPGDYRATVDLRRRDR